MATNAKTVTPETAVAATDRIPFGDASADGWAVIQAQKLAKALAAVSDDPAGLRAAMGVQRAMAGAIPNPTGTYQLGSSLFRAITLTTLRAGIDGTCTLSVLRNGVAVPGWDSLSITSTETDFTPTGGQVACAAGDVLAFSFSAVSGSGFTFGLTE